MQTILQKSVPNIFKKKINNHSQLYIERQSRRKCFDIEHNNNIIENDLSCPV